MNWWARTKQGLGIVLGALSMGASCGDDEPEPPPPPEVATPLPQESIVMIEAEVGSADLNEQRWVPLPVPQAGIERLARLYCWYERMDTTDNKLCHRRMVRGIDPLEEFERDSLAGANLGMCQANLCLARNETCAGFMLNEAARSPLPRVLDSSVIGTEFQFDELLLIPEAEREAALAKAGVSTTIKMAPRLRFQPPQAPSKAAALRGARNRYRAAGIIGQGLLYGADPRDSKCVDLFAPGGDTSPSTPLTPNADGHMPTWIDIYYSTVVDAVRQHSDSVFRTVDAMRDSAAFQVRGQANVEDLAATEWNGRVDSALAVAKLLGHGESDSAGAPYVYQLSSACDHKPKASDIGPTGVPVCPPIQEDEGAKKAKEQMELFSLHPSTTDPLGELTESANTQWQIWGLIAQALTQDETLSQMGVSKENVEKAALYKCAESKLTGTVPSPKATLTVGGQSTTVYYAAGAAQGTLPPPILTAHFTGAVQGNATQVDEPAYVGSGAIQTSDSFKKTLSDLSQHPAMGVTTQDIAVGTVQSLEGLAAEVGGRRLEFVIGALGTSGLTPTAEQLAVIVHGVPEDPNAAGQAGERYLLVRGLEGLKCVVGGAIDGKPCNPADYRVDLNAVGTYQTTADPRMTDLSGGLLRADFTTLPQPGDPTASIPIDEGVYVLRLIGGSAEPFGGVIPAPGALIIGTDSGFPWPQYNWATRLVIAPAGGTFEQVLANAITPNSDDCSKVRDSCAGLPSDIWPPLQSEIVGSPSELPFESSYRHWLELAKAAAVEADRLGTEIVEHGLQMDIRRERFQMELEELCGADATACGGAVSPTGAPEAQVYATLGDKEVCAWEVDGKLCDRQAAGLPETTPCVVSLPKNTAPNILACEQALASLGSTLITPILIDNKLNLIPTEDTPLTAGGCILFDELRGTVENREEVIRKIFQNLTLEDARTIAEQLRYEEGFGDHYSLKLGGAVIFDTQRKAPGFANSFSAAPCNISAEDEGSSSKYWTTPVDCYVSGKPDPVTGMPVCPPGVGKDGCLPGGPAEISLDTEPAALKARWAWGFGRLRRAVATLGMITGALNGPPGSETEKGTGMMVLRRVFTGAQIQDLAQQPPQLIINDSSGWPFKEGTSALRALWERHGTPWGQSKHFDLARCVALVGVEGIDPLTDPHRLESGRPVNFNGFLPNDLPSWADQHEYFNGKEAGIKVVSGFPVLCEDGSCTDAPGQIGVNPQMPYCELPDPIALATWKSQNPSNPFVTFEQFPTDVIHGQSFLNSQVSSGFVGVSFPGIAGVKSYGGTWQDVVDQQLWAPPSDKFCSSAGNADPASGVYRALCLEAGYDNLSALQGNSAYMHFGRMPTPGATYIDEQAIRTWLTPMGPGTKSKYGQMLFDLRGGSVRDGSAPFQYPLTQRNIFDALELACHAKTRSVTGDRGELP